MAHWCRVRRLYKVVFRVLIRPTLIILDLDFGKDGFVFLSKLLLF